MSTATANPPAVAAGQTDPVPLPLLVVLRGIGQIWFQENALTGALFALGVAICFPIQAAGIVIGSAIGCGLAWVLKFNKDEILAGIYGFNPALVGTATFFFFQPDAASISLAIVGCVIATFITKYARAFVPFPTYTAPFVVTTWVIHAIGKTACVAVEGGTNLVAAPTTEGSLGFALDATLHGMGQVMFQASLWTGILFLLGLAVSDREHAMWSLFAAIVGMLVATYHLDAGARALDPERLIERNQFDNVRLGLYGYNATLAAVSLSLWRRNLIAPILGILISVPITEMVPRFGVPALTAPFVLAAWVVIALGWLEPRLLGAKPNT